MSQLALAAWASGSEAPFFLDAMVKATALLGLAAVTALVLRRASAAARHWLWCCALGGLILLPAISLVVPGVEVPVLTAKSDEIEAQPIPPAADVQTDSKPTVTVSSRPAPRPPATRPAPPAQAPAPPRHTATLVTGPSQPAIAPSTTGSPDKRPASALANPAAAKIAWTSTAQWLLIAWAIGFCGALLPTAIGLVGNEVRRRRSSQVTDADWLSLLKELRGRWPLRRAVDLRQSHTVPIPITWGVVRPVILLPVDADVWAEPLRRAVLLHELAHIRRYDVGFQFVGRLAAALYWFHPLAWYGLARLRVECEYAADDCLVHAGHRRSDYAGQLLAVARSARRMRTPAVVAMARSNSLEERLRVLFDDARSHRPLTRRAALGFVTAVALVTATLASVRPGRAQASPPPPKSAQNSEPLPAPKSAQVVTGQVIGPKSGTGAGAPVAGASVYLLRRRQGTSITLPTRPRSAQADADGRFTFKKVAPGSYSLWAESGNRVSNLEELRGERVEMTANAAPAPFRLRLTEASRFRIRVTAMADGRPIAKAAIRFLWPDIERKFETDANGIALVEGVRPRDHVFQVVAEGFAAQVLTVAATQPGTTNDLAFALAPGGQIRGTLRDAEGQPMPFLRVGLRPAREQATLRNDSVRTDSNGRFVFDNVPLGETLEISVGHENQWKKQNVLLSPDRKSLTADLTFDKRPDSGSVVVHVTGPDHKPIAGAELSNPGSGSRWWRRGTTAANGECRLDRVYDFSGRYRLFVRAKGFVAQDLSFQPGAAAKPARIDVELQEGHTIRARVMLTNGKPAAKVRVFFDHGEHPWTTGGDTRTDDQGRFSLDSLPENCTFTIYPPEGYAPFRNQRLSLDRPTEDIVTLDTAGLVKGRVVDEATGKPAVPYRIRIMASHNRRQDEPWPILNSLLMLEGRVILEPDGQFEFGDLPPGAPLHLMISAKGYVDQSLDRVIALPDSRFKPLEIRLRKINPHDLRTVSGRLVTAEGKPAAGAEMRLWTTAVKSVDTTEMPFNWAMIHSGQLEQSQKCQQFLASVTDKEGGFTFANVRVAGYAELAYWGKAIVAGREMVRVGSDSEPLVNLRVQAVAAARLTVEVDRKAWPDAGQLQLSADSPAFDGRHELLNANQHRFTFDDLPSGPFRVQLLDRGRDSGDSSILFKTLAAQSVTLKAGETTTVRFEKR